MQTKGEPPCEKDSTESCISIAEKTAGEKNRLKSLFHWDFFKSFTALSTVALGLFYIAAATLFIWGSSAYVNFTQWGMPLITHTVGLVGIITITAIITERITIKKHDRNRKKTKRWERIFKSIHTIAILSCIFAIFFVATAAVIYLLDIKPSNSKLPVFLMTGVIFIVIFLGIEIYLQVHHIRKGKYSRETYYELWNNRFKRCKYMSHSLSGNMDESLS